MVLDDCLDDTTLYFNDEEESYKVTKGFRTSTGYILATLLICEDMDIDEDL